MTREEAIARVKHQRDWANEVNRMFDVEAFDMAIKALEQEPRKGHWIDIKNKNGTVIAVRCSKCGNSPKHAIKSDFCPNCGADMREGLRMTREEAIKTVKEHCYFASLVPAAREALDLMIKTVEDFEALNAINLDLADENEDLVERIGKLIGFIDFLRNTAQGKKKSLNLLEKVVKGELEEIRAEGENFVKPRTGEWIPVNEKRPVEFEKVLITYRLHYDNSIHVGIGNIITNDVNGKYHWNINEQDYIGWDMLAWMPLPEPYEEDK